LTNNNPNVVGDAAEPINNTALSIFDFTIVIAPRMVFLMSATDNNTEFRGKVGLVRN